MASPDGTRTPQTPTIQINEDDVAAKIIGDALWSPEPVNEFEGFHELTSGSTSPKKTKKSKWSGSKKHDGEIQFNEALIRKDLKSTQADPAVQTIFGDNIIGAHKMVFLGSCEADSGLLESCDSLDDLEKAVSSLLRKVLRAQTIARKVILISSASQVGIVDRVYHSEVIAKYPTSAIAYHGVKTVSGKGSATDMSFFVFIAHSKVFHHDVFCALQGKSNWKPNHIQHVGLTFDNIVKEVYLDAESGDGGSELVGAGNVFDIPIDAKIHRVKYLGSITYQSMGDMHAEVAKLLVSDRRDMRKQTKEKTLQHVIDFAHDGVVVVHGDGVRVLDAATRAQLSTPVVPRNLQQSKAIKTEEFLSSDTVLHVVKNTSGRHSPSLSRKKRPKSLTKVVGGANGGDATPPSGPLADLPAHLRAELLERVRVGELSMAEGAAEAQLVMEEIQDHLLCIAWKDEQLDVLHGEILVVKGTKKLDALQGDVDACLATAKRRADDPFAAKTKARATPLTDTLGASELDRDTILAVEMIGAGQFGEVFLASQHVVATDMDVQRAVKTLRKGANRRQRLEFCAEAELQLKLNHQNIVEVAGVCMMNEPFLCVLEFMPYGDLKKVLQTMRIKNLDVDVLEQAYMLSQVSDALQYMHSKRFVHMDLATRNILVGAGTLIKVADFGLSRKYNKKKDYYKLSGKMVLPMLWTCPENFPPIVTRGVNEPSSGDEIPRYDERTDMWAFGCCIWEVLAYGEDPYGNELKLLDNLKRIYAGYRLEAPPGSNKDLVNMMTQCFKERAERPVFQATTAQLNALVAAQGGKAGVRDLGLLLHEGLTHKLMRKSTVVASTRRASAAGLSHAEITKVAAMAMKSISEEYGFGDHEEEEMLAETEAAAASMAPTGRKSSSPSKWGQVRAVLPFLTFHSKWVKDHTGKVVRDIDHAALPALSSEIDENPFLSDDSDTDLDEVLETDAKSRDASSTGSSSPLTLTSRTISIVDPSDQPPPSIAGGVAGGVPVGGPEHDDDEEEEVEEIDGFPDLEDDMAILQLMTHRREKHAIAEAKHQEEIRAAYLKQKAIDDSIHAKEMARITAEKQRDFEAAEAEKQKIYDEAQERLAKDLRFSFSWGK